MLYSYCRNFTKKILKQLVYKKEYRPLVIKNQNLIKRNIFNVVGKGNLNPDKVFYVIQRYPGTGLFSNLAFVINHIKVATDMGFIPIVDMKNFPSIYSEKNKILCTNNSWEYYFNQITNYTLEEVYKSKNIILTNNIFYAGNGFNYRITESDTLLDIFKKNIFLKKTKLKTINYLKKKLLSNKKTLGIHFRGTGYKIEDNPLTINQMINKINNILSEEKYDQIFLVTEDSINFKGIIDYFGSKVIYLKTSQRGKTNLEVWNKYPRTRHRYKMGREILYETYLLSYCDGYFDIDTNPKQFVLALNLNSNQKR